MQFNTAFRIHAPLCVDPNSLPSLNVYDVKPDVLLRVFPAYQRLFEKLRVTLPDKKNTLLSIHSAHLKPGVPTCSDPGWHLDGKLESNQETDHYALVCFGEEGTRTQFYREPIKRDGLVLQPPASIDERRALFHSILGHDLLDESKGSEIPNGAIATYTSRDFHKGRISPVTGKRLLVRVAVSDRIRPKPFRI